MVAERPLLLIAVTPPAIFDGEGRDIVRLLDEGGFDMVHLRHPGATLRQMAAIVESVPQRLHGRLKLHGHFDLINDYNLGGLHLNHRCPTAPPLYRGALSRSCHSVDEVVAASGAGYTYVTLSPVFDSISKAGYSAAFDEAELRRLDDIAAPPVVALGGVTAERLATLRRYNFAGAAMLGAAGWRLTTP